VSFYFPEADPVCGPGAYALESLVLAFQLVDPLPGGALPLTLLLYAADPATGAPLTQGNFLQAAFPAPGAVTAAPAFFTIDFPASWVVDSLAGRYYSIVMYTGAYTVGWAESYDSLPGNLPYAGPATPSGAFVSLDSGSSWVPDSS